MRLFVQPQLSYALPALLVSFFGAVAIGLMVHVKSSSGLGPVVVWILLVGGANGLTMWFNAWASRRVVPDRDLPRLVLVKSFCQVLQGLAWGLGIVLLNVPGETVTVVAPSWAMVTGVGLLMFASAPWPPSSYAFMTALFLPGVMFFLGSSVQIEYIIGVALVVCFPFCLIIGKLAARYVGDLVAARLSVNALLERESQLTARLKQLNEERTRFFSSASHDLRQPLQALSFYTTLVGLSPGPAEQRDLLARLADCADTLDRQFNAILGVASADAVVERASPRPLLLDPIIRRAVAGHLAEAERKGLRLRSVPTSAAALAVPEGLERILSNFIGNAVRYTRDGGVVVGARRRAGRIVVMVADSGIGIAEEDKERIFDDFFQAANPERNGAKGFGLGLAIVKRLAEALGWPIKFQSQVGKGSIFMVVLPQADAALPTKVDDAASDNPPALDLPPVLVLDDDGLVRDAMARLLDSWGVQHRACATPEEALSHLSEDVERSWCVMLDYRLQGGATGIEVLDTIRKLHGDRHLCLLISGETDPDVERAAVERGVFLLRKPLKPIRLRAALSSLALLAPQPGSARRSDPAEAAT